MLAFIALLAIANSWAANQTDLKIDVVGSDLVVTYSLSKDSDVPISREDDNVYLWNENDLGYRYYAVGRGQRENLYVGTGRIEDESGAYFEYLVFGVRNLDAQFGRFAPRDWVMTFLYNGLLDPGLVEDGGFGIYPERRVSKTGVADVTGVYSRATLFELGSNQFVTRIDFRDGAFMTRSGWDENRISVLGDGFLRVKLTRTGL